MLLSNCSPIHSSFRALSKTCVGAHCVSIFTFFPMWSFATSALRIWCFTMASVLSSSSSSFGGLVEIRIRPFNVSGAGNSSKSSSAGAEGQNSRFAKTCSIICFQSNHTPKTSGSQPLPDCISTSQSLDSKTLNPTSSTPWKHDSLKEGKLGD